MIGLKLVDSIAKIEKDIKSALVRDLNTYLNKRKGAAVEKLRKVTRFYILSQPEMGSLQQNGVPFTLNSLFGIPSGGDLSAINAIADAVVGSIQIKFSKIDENFKGGVTFNIQPEDFQNLLGLPQGHVVTKKGSDLHWLNWLLTKGDSVVVAGYQYDAQGNGRSGSGRMIAGNSFRVPPSFSGTLSNNFVTRALEGKQKEIERIISEVLK
jgi:hypothetical protein|tara:strand:- start:275 stop:904 length:630 start_codon:yes stop_codon:yes gene_type:complete